MSATFTLGITLLALAASGGDDSPRINGSSLPPKGVIVETADGSVDQSLEFVEQAEGISQTSCEPGCKECQTCGCGNGHLPCTWRCWWFSCCDMPQHMPYYPAEHGYYYFRPYHHTHVLKQRDAVLSWGGDPRNPYSNEIFDRVYAELRAEEAGGKDVEPKIDEDEGAPPPPVEEMEEDPKLEPVVPPSEQANSETIRRLGHFVR